MIDDAKLNSLNSISNRNIDEITMNENSSFGKSLV